MKDNEEMFEQDSFQHYLGRLVFYVTSWFGLIQVFLNLRFLIQEVLNFYVGLELNFGGPPKDHKIVIYMCVLFFILNILTIPFVIKRNRDGQPKQGISTFWESDLSLKRFLVQMFFISLIVYSLFLTLYTPTSLLPDPLNLFSEEELYQKIPSNILTIPFFYFLISWIVVSKTKVSS